MSGSSSGFVDVPINVGPDADGAALAAPPVPTRGTPPLVVSLDSSISTPPKQSPPSTPALPELPGLRRITPPPSYASAPPPRAPPAALVRDALPDIFAGVDESIPPVPPPPPPNPAAAPGGPRNPHLPPRIPVEFARLVEVVTLLISVGAWTDAIAAGAVRSDAWHLFFDTLLAVGYATVGFTLCAVWELVTQKPSVVGAILFNRSLEDGFTLAFGVSTGWAWAHAAMSLVRLATRDDVVWTSVVLCLVGPALGVGLLFLRPSRLLMPGTRDARMRPVRMMLAYTLCATVMWLCALAYDTSIVAATRFNITGTVNVIVRICCAVVLVMLGVVVVHVRARRTSRLTDDVTAARTWPPRPLHGSLWVVNCGLFAGWLIADAIWALMYTFVVGIRSLDIFVAILLTGFCIVLSFSLTMYAGETRTERPLRRYFATAFMSLTAVIVRDLVRILYFNLIKFGASIDAAIYYSCAAAVLAAGALAVIIAVHWPARPPRPRPTRGTGAAASTAVSPAGAEHPAAALELEEQAIAAFI